MNSMLALFSMGGMEIALISGVVLLLFGGKKLPGLARGFGQSIKEFKNGMKEEAAPVKKASVVEEARK